MAKYGLYFLAGSTQYVEVEAEREPDEEDFEFEDRIIDAAYELLEPVPWIRGIDIGEFEWDEHAPQLVEE